MAFPGDGMTSTQLAQTPKSSAIPHPSEGKSPRKMQTFAGPQP